MESKIDWQKRYNELQDQAMVIKAKVERYEAALKEILKQHDYYSVIDLADKALSGEGDRICPNCKKVFNADRHGCCRECGSDEFQNQKEDKQ